MAKIKTNDMKEYRVEYYANNKEKYQVKNKTCMYCGNTCTACNMKKHIRTKKHMLNKITFYMINPKELEKGGVVLPYY